ncbi:MAG: hypothetical protein JW927_08965 [Deltaproteobacteria bacterium]|nr:hypothetical protein [Deltaproteobacteria bacterium]
MLRFVIDNILIVLTLFGAIISFLASFIGIISKKKPITILALLAVMGFATGVSYQLYDFNKKQEDKRLKAAKEQVVEAAQLARDNVINEINLNVQQTKVTVDSIAELLNKTAIQEVATELVTINTSGSIDFEETMAFAKGAPEMWPKYAEWLSSVDRSKAEPSLSLTVNANHYYDSGLLLAYLLTSKVTRDSLEDIINQHNEWHNFQAEENYLKSFTPHAMHLNWVLFYDKTIQKLAAFAEAKAFTQELMVYHRLKQHDKIDALLNNNGANTITELQKSFPSIQKAVSETSNPAELVKLMIDQQLAISVTSADKKPFIVRLANMIQLAVKKG